MDIPYRSFLSSKPFLIVGPNGSEFYVHGPLISQCSPVLAVDVNGSMQEAESRTINIKDIDEDLDDDTVMRFIEFAYSGDYIVPPPEIHLTSKDVDTKSSNMIVKAEPSKAIRSIFEPPSEPPAEDYTNELEISRAEDDRWEWSAHSSRKQPVKMQPMPNKWVHNSSIFFEPKATDPRPLKRDVLWSKFCEQASVKNTTPRGPRKSDDPCEVYASVFLCHARLYVFSNRYECDSLRDLCLQKLRLTLSTYQLYLSRSSDITALVQYTYTHTPDFKQGSDKLRNLVSDYVVCHIEQMCKVADFLDMLQEFDGLAKELMVKLMSRLE